MKFFDFTTVSISKMKNLDAYLLTLLFLLNPWTVNAASASTSAEAPVNASASENDGIVIIKRNKNEIYDDSSEFGRLNKKYALTLESGYAFAPAVTLGINAAYFYDRNNLFQVDYVAGESPIFFTGLRYKALALNWKHFSGNSFYTKLGLADRTITVFNRDNPDVVFPRPGREIGRGEVLAFELTIGNQWQWDNFTLGCDWVGFMQPIARLGSESDPSGLKDWEIEDLNRNMDYALNKATINSIRFFLGASF